MSTPDTLESTTVEKELPPELESQLEQAFKNVFQDGYNTGIRDALKQFQIVTTLSQKFTTQFHEYLLQNDSEYPAYLEQQAEIRKNNERYATMSPEDIAKELEEVKNNLGNS